MSELTPTCKEHSGVCVDIQNLKQDVNDNATRIRLVEEAVIKLTALYEQAIANQNKKTLDADTKKSLIKYGFLLLVILILALIGSNILNALNPSTLVK